MVLEGIKDKFRRLYWKVDDWEKIKDSFKHIYGRIKRTKCDAECFHYGMFGGKGGCDKDDWGSTFEPLNPGDLCLHPEKKEYGINLGVVSGGCFCSALEGGIEGVVIASENDAKFVQALTGVEVKKF